MRMTSMITGGLDSAGRETMRQVRLASDRDRGAINTDEIVLNFSLESQDESAHSASNTNVKGAKGALKERDHPIRKRGSATTSSEKSRLEIRRVRSGDNLRRSRSASVLRLPRAGQIITEKRQGIAEHTRGTSIGTNVEGQRARQRPEPSEILVSKKASAT